MLAGSAALRNLLPRTSRNSIPTTRASRTLTSARAQITSFPFESSLRGFRSSSAAMAAQSPFPHFATLAIHAGYEFDQNGSVVCGIGTSTTFAQKEPGKVGAHLHAIMGPPSRSRKRKCLARVGRELG